MLLMPHTPSLLTLNLLVAMFLFSFGTFPETASSATKVDRIVAQVNRNIITLSELEARIATMAPAQRATISSGGDLQRKVLDLMIEQELINQAAVKTGIMVNDSEVNEAIKSILAANKINMSQLTASLNQVGTSLPAFREQLRGELLKNKLLSYGIASRIVVTDEEVVAFLSGESPLGSAPVFSATGVSDFSPVRMIFLRSSRSQTASVMARAAKIKAEIEGGLSFAEAAKKYSEGPGKDTGGDPGNVVVQDLQPELQELAKRLTPGQVSEPLNGGDAVLLITIVSSSKKTGEDEADSGKRGKKKKPIDNYSAEEKQQGRRQLEQLKLRQKYETWINDLKNQAVIKITL
jgi:peptidyl-prolyl cis-trans isomerase SurA